MPNEAAIGIITGYVSGNALKAASLTQIQTLDLLCEGEIEGLVTGEYNYAGNIGSTGYSSYLFNVYPTLGGQKYLRSIYWNEVPVASPSESGIDKFNFQSVQLAFTPGTPNGSKIASLNSSLSNDLTISRSLGERLRAGAEFSKIYRILNKDCKAADINVKVNSLSTSDPTTGEITDTEVNYNIYYRAVFSNPVSIPGFDNQFTLYRQESIKGKIDSPFIKKTRLIFNSGDTNLSQDPSFLGWEIKILRTTPDPTSSYTRNQTYVDSITEIYDDVYTYPNSSIVAAKFSAEYFSQIPSRAFDVKGLKVKIPSNYDPILRTYSSTWDGTFKSDKEWTNNPAWCFYDLITNKRYGLGKYIDENLVDKWTLYQISQYCDVLVSDGFGGLEPRFSCNLVISSREQAYKVINDFASIFNAITYYAGGSIFTVQDSQKNKDNFYQFTNASVEDGNFNYSSSSRRVRHTIAIVRYNDKTNFFKPAVEYVEDIEGIKKYGYRELDLTAFGCTSRGQALRFGRWALLSETLETETVDFTAGLEATKLRPGDVFKIFDRYRRTKRYGGRTWNIQNYQGSGIVTLDSEITGFSSSQRYNFSLLTPTYNYDPTLVTLSNEADIAGIRRNSVQVLQFSGLNASIISGRSQINFLTGDFGTGNVFNTGEYVVSGNLIWTIEPTGTINTDSEIKANQYNYYRTIAIKEKENEPQKYQVSALQYNVDKYIQIESGLSFSLINPNTTPPNPSNLFVYKDSASTNNTTILDYQFNGEVSGVAAFRVFAKRGSTISLSEISGNTYLIDTLPNSRKSGQYLPSNNGTYYFAVHSINSAGTLSLGGATANYTILEEINPFKDVIISSLTLDTVTGTNGQGNKSYQSYTNPNPTFKWQVGFNNAGALLPTDLKYKVSFREPSPSGLNIPGTHVYYQETGYRPPIYNEPDYIFQFTGNVAAVSNTGLTGPFRTYDMVVEAVNDNGQSSAGSNYENSNGYDILYVENPKASKIWLGTGTILNPLVSYNTTQWITTDGNININFTGTLPSDIAGGYVYYSNSPFNENQARNQEGYSFTIDKTEFTNFTNPLVIQSAFTGTNSQGYVGIAPYDLFDEEYKSQGYSIETGLALSNIVKIERRGGTLEDAKVKAKIEVKFNRNNLNAPEFNGHNIATFSFLGNQSIRIGAGGTRFTTESYARYRIAFELPIGNPNYNILMSTYPNPTQLVSDDIRSDLGNTDSFSIEKVITEYGLAGDTEENHPKRKLFFLVKNQNFLEFLIKTSEYVYNPQVGSAFALPTNLDMNLSLVLI